MTEQTKKEKKDFWNNWDFKTIIAILTPIVLFAFGYGNLTSKVDSNKIEADKDRLFLIKKMEEMQSEFKDFIKEYREDKRIQENNIKEFYKRYKLEEK